MSLCAELRVPLATDKLEGPSTSLSFLRIFRLLPYMEIWLLSDKLARIHHLLKEWLPRKKAIKR